MSELTCVINHLFLPRVLPEFDDGVSSSQGVILRRLWQETKRLHQLLNFKPVTSEVMRMMDCWCQIQPDKMVDSAVLHARIEALDDGQCLALFVNEQNATIVIERLQCSAIVSWFQTSLLSSTVNGNVGDLVAWYPRASVSVPRLGILQCQALSQNLADLCNNANAISRPLQQPFPDRDLEVANPDLVSRWLMAILCGDGSVLTRIHSVQKKIRDEALRKYSTHPFRRSGLYFSAKVVLHIRLTALLSREDGTIVYKLLILSTLHTVCVDWWQSVEEAASKTESQAYAKIADLAMQLLAKLARRSHKLEQLCESSLADGDDTHLLRTVRTTLETVASTVAKVRLKLGRVWQSIVDRSRSASAAVSVEDLEAFDCERYQSLATAKPAIKELDSLTSKQLCSAEPKVSLTRNRDAFSSPDLKCLRTYNEANLGIALIDIERWLQAQDFNEPPRFSASVYYDLLIAYLNNAKLYYEDDTLGTSRMVLAAMRLVIEMDRVSCGKHALLQQYAFGANTDQFKFLQLVSKDELDYMFKIWNYIAMRNRAATYYTSVLDQNVRAVNSFGVKYAQSDEHMLQVKEEIEAETLENCKKKIAEIREKKDLYKSIMQKARLFDCDDDYVCYDWLNKNARTMQQKRFCVKCALEEQANGITANNYTKPLPADENGKAAVVFELCMPIDLALLRDAQHELEATVWLSKTNGILSTFLWCSYSPLTCWAHSISKQNIRLGSTEKMEFRSYKLKEMMHRPDEDFISLNAMNLVLSLHNVQLQYEKCSTPHCRFTNQVGSPYSVLKWALENAEHDENQVLCRQAECPQELSLSEFQVFGCLRAGHRTQLHNVLDALEARSLSFKEWSVSALVLQAVYQVGPICAREVEDKTLNESEKGGNEVRVPEAHESLRDSQFVLAFLDVLSRLLEEIADNWRDHMTLLLIISLAARVLSLCPNDVQHQAERVLLRCREISTTWEQKVATAIGSALDLQQGDKEKLRLKLAMIAAGTVLTFAVDSKHILLDKSSIPIWLRSNTRIFENVLKRNNSRFFYCVSDNERKFILKTLLRRVRWCYVLCEDTFFDLIGSVNHLPAFNCVASLRTIVSACYKFCEEILLGSRTAISLPWPTIAVLHTECFKRFIDEHWADGKKGSIWNVQRSGWWISFDFCTNICNCLRKNFIQVSFDGQFLVDGLPIGRLPHEIESDELYQRVFYGVELDVQPSVISPTAMVTEHSINNCFYSFQKTSKALLVIERDESNAHTHVESLLLPHTFFKNDLPEELCSKYSHWLNRRTQVVSFRPTTFNHKNFTTSVEYTLDLNTSLLQCCKTGEYLLDQSKRCFKELYDAVFHRLESKRYVHVFYDVTGDQRKVTVELPRFGLHFERTKTGVHCLDYQNMQVAACQKLGTLIGLERGLLLAACSEESKQSVLLVPHSLLPVEYRLTDMMHLKSPPFFAYNVDNRLKQLRAPQSDVAVLYLAYLHAITSFVLADPFSGLLGSERALQLLQSAACFSCKPYDFDALNMLKVISQLSPTRTLLYNKPFQSITWPEKLCSTQALEAYCMIAHKLNEQSLRAAFAFKAEEEKKEKICSPNDLNYRALWKSAQQRKLLTKEWLAVLEQKPAATLLQSGNYRFDSTLNTVRLLAAYSATSAKKLSKMIDLKSLDLVTCFNNLVNLRGINPAGQARFQFPNVSSWLDDLPGQSILVHGWISNKLKQQWLSLCDYALHCSSKEDVFRLAVYVSFFADKNGYCSELFALLVIAIERKRLSHLRVPRYQSYENTSHLTYDKATVISVIKRHCTNFEDYKTRFDAVPPNCQGSDQFRTKLKEQYDSVLDSQCNQIERAVFSVWSMSRNDVPLSVLDDMTEVKQSACSELGSTLVMWRSNMELRNFLRSLTNELQKFQPTRNIKLTNTTSTVNNFLRLDTYLESSTFDRLLDSEVLPLTRNSQADIADDRKFFEAASKKQAITAESILNSDSFPLSVKTTSKARRALLEDLQTSWTLFCSNPMRTSTLLPCEELRSVLQDTLTNARQTLDTMWQEIVSSLSARQLKPTHRALEAAGLWPPIVPSTVLPCISCCLNVLAIPEPIQQLVMEFVLLAVHEQRVARCLSYCRAGQGACVQLERELCNTPHTGWSPYERPEWLLFELENDLAIRPVQAKVANHMIDPIKGQNSVLQLNMGEGKTAVIVPIVLVALGDSNRLARLTVLKPLLNMNFEALKHKLGWLLNRRVYYIPVFRDAALTLRNVVIFREILQECMINRGVYITLPEHRNSFKLKCLEVCRIAHQQAEANECLALQSWLDSNARDVLDESDEILHFKFQLVYTLDEQQVVDGGQSRWKLAEAILKLAAKHANLMAQSNCEGNFYEHVLLLANKKATGGFPTIRLLSDKLYPQLCEGICNDILNCQADIKLTNIKTPDLQLLKRVVLSENTNSDDFKELKQLLQSDKCSLKLILLLRGILSYGLLFLALNKRWRVNYGVNDRLASRGVRAMAVPFRGKDMPSDRAEFGHPDVAILFTVLSYYYSGLSDGQLSTVFDKLNVESNCDEVYYDLVKDANVRPSARQYSGVNLDDSEQRQYLFDVLRHHLPVIDYFMNKTVFPKEAKSFPGKLVSSAWDLAEMNAHPTTGFSGTNETKLLLPLTISQNDLTELQQTNGMMIASLLRKENDDYDRLESDATGMNILERLQNRIDVRVLLDVGGLILDMNNRTVAQTWLQLTQAHASNIAAAVYFNEDDLYVLDRDGRDVRFDLSPHKNRLDNCVVYLDDAHTRGTDLRFPHGFRACVTLGKGVTKDRLVQACMRMRLLGQGHSVSFLAAYDVHLDISTLSGASEKFGSLNVLNWALRNSGDLIEDGFMHWSSMAASYWRRLKAYERWKRDGNLRNLGNISREKEVYKVTETCSLQRAELTIPEIAAKSFGLSETASSRHQLSKSSELSARVVKTCHEYVSTVKRFVCTLSEEQERELQCELLTEKQIYRPGPAEPHIPQIPTDLFQFVQTGHLVSNSASILPLDAAFKHTSLKETVEADGWLKQLFISTGFVSVLKRRNLTETSIVDDFLRTPRWVLTCESDSPCFVVVSQFEANRLLPFVRNSKAVKLRLFSAAKRQYQINFFKTPGVTIENRNSRINQSRGDELSQLLVQLNVFAGSVYFKSEEEQENWLSFLGLCPSPRSAREQELFDNGQIEPDGFLNATNRGLDSTCSFQSNPSLFVRDLIEIRNFDAVHEKSHVMTVLVDGKRPLAQQEKRISFKPS